MSVTAQTPYNSYTANGATTVFPYGFLLLDTADLTVTVDGVIKALTTDYTVSGLGNQSGGNITFLVAPTNGAKVLLSRLLTMQRLTDYQNNGDLFASTVNQDFDRLWLALQQLQQNDLRALKLPYDTATDQVLTQDAAARANKGIRFDASGNMIISTYDPDAAQASAASSATAAAGSATSAASSATAAAGSATAASGSATAAANSATEAANSASSVGFTAADIQKQTLTAFTTGGTSTAYTLTPAPALAALATNQRFSVTFHTAAGATPTLAISGLTAKNLKYRDATGTKQAITSTQVPTGWVSDVFYDGTDYVVLSIAVSGGMPPGAIVYVCQSTAPSGFLKANGAAVSRTTYSELFTAIGTLFGIGDGATTFNLPDLRGEFLRGWDNSRGIDSGRAIGTWQNEELKSHTHALVDGGQIQSTAAGGAYGSSATGSSNTTIANTGGVETRPRNVALLACIKY